MIKLIKYTIFLLATASMLFGCSAKQRLSRIIRKHPELLESDSTTKSDTTIRPGAKTEGSIPDSTLKKSSRDNPIVIDSNGIKTTIYHEHNHTYYRTECPPDTTINHHHYINNNYPIIESKKPPWWWYLIAYCAGLFTASIAGTIVKILFKR